ncbi:hypothetical protein ACMXYX_04950 [Neptuniibacter sp. QD72_48]|uniref:hypothetical protein n=1 Tax=Neptuniibacter sp. QD72_48 TaxID=3398214 RepID=UPI0039F5A34A
MKTKEDYWPRGLYRYSDGRGFKYRLPFKIDGKYKDAHIGKVSLKEAIEQTDILNKRFEDLALAKKNEKALERLQRKKLIGKYERTVHELIQDFTREYLLIKYENDTLKNKIYASKIIAKYFAKRKLIELEVKEWVDFIASTTDSHDPYSKYKTIITQFYQYCQGIGSLPASHPNFGKLIDIPSLQVKPDKKRDKMSLKQFQLLYNAAEPAIKDILKVGILTGLRSGDILTIKAQNIQEGFLYVIPAKTRDLQHPQKLRFSITEDLIECGITDPVKHRENPKRPKKVLDKECPFLFNYVYDRDNESKNKEHPNQLLRRYFLSKFEDAILSISDEEWSKYNTPDKREERPTFHEVRALYADLCQAVLGLSEQEISKRLGHRDRSESPTTKKYLSGTWYEVTNHIPFNIVMSMTNSELDKLLGKDIII